MTKFYYSDMEYFVNEKCYWPIFDALKKKILTELNLLKFNVKGIGCPVSASLKDMKLQFVNDVKTQDSNIYFEAIVSSEVELTNKKGKTMTINQRFALRCFAVIDTELKYFNVEDIRKYKNTSKERKKPYAIVPFVSPEHVERDAEEFLARYCPAALVTSMAVPIRMIATELLGLEIIHGHRLSCDGSVLGMVCMSDTDVKVYDVNNVPKHVFATRGTIFVDADAEKRRGEGAVNFTIAHEVAHWIKHRPYADIWSMRRDAAVAVCRNSDYEAFQSNEDRWTDSERVEWYANNLTSRLLLPRTQFIVKAKELCRSYGFYGSAGHAKGPALERVVERLAALYKVSKQAVRFRLSNVGFDSKAAHEESGYPSVSINELFCEYSRNKKLRRLLGGGMFVFVEGMLVANDPKYVQTDKFGAHELTLHTLLNQSKCVIRFSTSRGGRGGSVCNGELSAFGRFDGELCAGHYYDEETNTLVAETVGDLIKRESPTFCRRTKQLELIKAHNCCWHMMRALLSHDGMNREDFLMNSHLSVQFYYKILNGKESARPGLRKIIAFAVALKLDVDIAERIILAAGYNLNDSKEHQALRFCLIAFSGYFIEVSNEFLKSHGFKPLTGPGDGKSKAA